MYNGRTYNRDIMYNGRTYNRVLCTTEGLIIGYYVQRKDL